MAVYTKKTGHISLLPLHLMPPTADHCPHQYDQQPSGLHAGLPDTADCAVRGRGRTAGPGGVSVARRPTGVRSDGGGHGGVEDTRGGALACRHEEGVSIGLGLCGEG